MPPLEVLPFGQITPRWAIEQEQMPLKLYRASLLDLRREMMLLLEPVTLVWDLNQEALTGLLLEPITLL